MNPKEIKDMKYDELVDYCASHVMQMLIKGKFRDGIWEALSMAIDWQRARNGS